MKKKTLLTLTAAMTLLSAPMANALGTPERKVLMEEFTGTWCGFCPRGLAALEYMAEQYPDRFIGVSFHAPGSGKYDELTTAPMSGYPLQIMSYPSARLDRGVSIDPYYGLDGSTGQFGLEGLWQEAMQQPTTVGLNIEATHDATNPALINVSATTWFTTKPANRPRVIVYLIGDKVGEGMGLKQTNNMAGNSGSFIANMDRFTKGSPVIKDMTYDDVFLMGTDLAGADLLPQQYEAQKDYTLTYQFDTSNCHNTEGRKVIDAWFDNYKVVVALIDGATGRVLNANMVRVPKRAPIYLNSVSLPATADLEVGSTMTLDVTTDPTTVYDDRLLWMTSDAGVATVDQTTGLIKGVAPGQCTITVLSSENSRVTSTTTLTVSMPRGEYDTALSVGKLRRGCNGVVDVKFNSSLDLKQLKFSVIGQDWFDFAAEPAALLSDRAEADALMTEAADGNLEVSITDVKAGEGSLVRLFIKVKEDAGRDTDFSVANFALTNQYDVDLTLTGMMSAVTVKDLILGDVNGNGQLDPDDLDLAADAVIGVLDPIYVAEAADYNGCGHIDVLDLVDMAYALTMTDNAATTQGINGIIDPSVFSYNLQPLTIVPGKTRNYDIDVKVMRGFVAAQFEVELPENFDINSIQAAGSRHRAKIGRQDTSGSLYKAVIYSPLNVVMTSAQQCPIASLQIAAPEQMMDQYEGWIKNTVLVSDSFEKEDVGNASFVITKDTSGVSAVEAAGFAVSAADGVISVSGAQAGMTLSLYAPDGRPVAKATTAADGTATIKAPRGIYLLTDGTHTRRILL